MPLVTYLLYTKASCYIYEEYLKNKEKNTEKSFVYEESHSDVDEFFFFFFYIKLAIDGKNNLLIDNGIIQ